MTPSEVLDSWKQIADYLKRGVRTVQRWERDEGLPVHRHGHKKRGTIIAYRSELQRWIDYRCEDHALGPKQTVITTYAQLDSDSLAKAALQPDFEPNKPANA